jgi:nickel-dependent lactate racemase
VDCTFEVSKRGGVVVLIAECSEGYGNNEFCRFMSEFNDSDDLEKSLKKKFRIEGLIAYRLLKVLQRNEVFLVSAMPDYYALETFRMKTARTANEALRYAFESVGRKGKVSIISCGNLIIPLVKGEE